MRKRSRRASLAIGFHPFASQPSRSLPAHRIRVLYWISLFSRWLTPCLTREITPLSPDYPITLTPSIWRLVVDIADEIGQVGVTQLLTDRRVLAGVIPVVVDVPQQQ